MPWADALYACDFAWWKSFDGVPDFAGLKLSADRKVRQHGWDVHHITVRRGVDRLELIQLGTVGWGGNSGFHALNLAVQMNPAKIVLLGYDMTIAHGVHWHGNHSAGLNNPTRESVERWRKCIDDAAQVIDALGIKVVNASPISTLRNYPKNSLVGALEC